MASGYFIATPASGAIPLTTVFSGYVDFSPTSGTWYWDLDDGSPRSSGNYDYPWATGVYLSVGTYYPVVTFSGDYLVLYTGLFNVFDPTAIIGLVEGEGLVLSFLTISESIDGFTQAWGNINGNIEFYYPPTPFPPTSTGPILRSIKPILTNKGRYPYKPLLDIIVSKVDFVKNGKLSYLSNLPIELWMNYLGTWGKVEDGVTDRYGSCYITHSTSQIPSITNCLGVVKVLYQSGEYVSNIIRYNFIPGKDSIIIDAGTCAEQSGVFDRTGYNIYDAGNAVALRTEYIVYSRQEI